MAWNETAQERHGRSLDRHETDLTDERRPVIGPLVPPPARMGRPREHDMREVFNAVRPVPGTGCRWRAVPRRLPQFASVRNHFHAWRDSGVLDRMMDALRAHAREPAGRSEEPTAAAAGSRSAKATESGGPSGHDAGKKIKGRTRHVTADVEGFPVMIAVHEASAQDRDGAPGDPRHAGEGSAGNETVGGWRPCGAETGGRAGGARSRTDPGDRPQAEGSKGLRRHSPPGGGAHLRLDVAVPASGEGPRAVPGELPGAGAARGLPVPHAQGCTGDNAMDANNKPKSMAYDSSSEACP